MKRRIISEITVETEEAIVIHRRGDFAGPSCAACSDSPRMITPEQAAEVFRVSSRLIYRWIEAGQLHFLESSAGVVLVCPNSLSSAQDLEALRSPIPNKQEK